VPVLVEAPPPDTVAPEIAVPPELVTVPEIAPVVTAGDSVKLCVLVPPAETTTFCVEL
jgi:hypothetical protein